ncbi:TAP-like protein-domain-containing protein [Thermothelomyces heterothallicus CBS 202.75]|uniref:TAP-like protein-domain-containing protein n=1 Tax=Thermothelomyces heterothallicus CBS 202.75 TaxID=1149848 RepID=UPI003742013D
MNPWESITPSPDLAWHTCYTAINPSFLCARLTVPMDYAHENDDPDGLKVHLALVLLPPASQGQTPSNHTTTDPPRKAPLLINPGGPGGSGAFLALLMGPSLQRALGTDQPILGFDPRGVGFTTPVADCWAAPPPPDACDDENGGGGGGGGGGAGPACEDDAAKGLLRRVEWEQVNAAYGLVGESEAATRYLEAGHRGVNALCRSRDDRHGGTSGLAWSGTGEVARDMARIVDKWDEWVDREEEEAGVAAEREMRGKLVYWGFSYGTYLGATFARMFPHRVGRLLLDGVVDAELYEEPVWEESLVDADKVLDEFFRYCAAAGRDCALYRDGDQADDVRRKYEAVMERLRTSPVTFIHPDYFYPVILRESLVKQLAFAVLYSPIQGFPGLAWILDCIYEGRYKQLSAMFQDAELMCSVPGNNLLMGLKTDAQRAIMCSDKRQPVNMTVPDWEAEHKKMAELSQFAGIWMGLMMQCSGWDISPPHRAPMGPWTSSRGQFETANPILFLSNTHDPVTPLRAAVKMALKFKGAGLLEQKSLGHCTVSTVSRCTTRVVREYLASGKVPPPPAAVDGNYTGEWMRCDVDEIPWRPADPKLAASLEDEERDMIDAWRQLRRTLDSMERWNVGRWGKGMDGETVMELFREVKIVLAE